MSRPAPLVLVVDDDPAIRQVLGRELALAGYEPLLAADGVEGQEQLERHRPDLAITDLAMPRADGMALLAAVRRRDRTPVIVLSVRGEEEDKVRALDRGADDYVVKPFSLRELLARVRTQLRRAGVGEAPAVLRFPGLEIDRERRTVTQEGRAIRLTPTELGILELLAVRAGRPVTLRQIIAAVWHGAPATSADTVRVHGRLLADLALGVESPELADMLALPPPAPLPPQPLLGLGARARLALHGQTKRIAGMLRARLRQDPEE